MTAKDVQVLIEQNNQLRQQLNPENEAAYSQLLLYIRFRSLTRSELASESLLLEILQDFLQAQAHGQSFQEYFGRDPKAAADDMLANLPRGEAAKSMGHLVILCLLHLFLFFNFGPLINPFLPLRVGLTLVAMGLGGLVIFLTLRILSAFNWSEKAKFISMAILFSAYIGIVMCCYIFWKNHDTTLYLTDWLGVLAAVFILCALYLQWHIGMSGILRLVLICLVIVAVLSRFSPLSAWFASPIGLQLTDLGGIPLLLLILIQKRPAN